MVNFVRKPQYCPNCGKPHVDVQTCFKQMDMFQKRRMFVKYCEVIFDCYCKECGWSGEISPDQNITKPYLFIKEE